MSYETEITKVTENRARRAADRQGLRLVKSRVRDPRAIDHGRYMLVDIATNTVVYGTGDIGRPVATFAEIEEYLAGVRS